MEHREHERVHKAQAAWIRRRAYLWLFWAFVGLALLIARFFVLPHFDVASSEWPGRTLMLALILLVGGSIQYKLALRRARAIEEGATSGEAFDAIKDEDVVVTVAAAAENVVDVAEL